MCTDDLRFIGLVTSRKFDADTVSNSCHVFMTEVDLSLEEIRKRARAFQIEISPSHQEDGSDHQSGKESSGNVDQSVLDILTWRS